MVSLGGGVDAQGEVHLAVGRPLPFTLPPSLRLRVGADEPTPGTVFPVGAHAFEVIDASGSVRLAGVLVVPPRPPTVITAGHVVRATFVDDVPEELAPQLEMTGGTVPLTRVSPRVWEAPRPATGVVTVSWRGRALSRFEVGSETR